MPAATLIFCPAGLFAGCRLIITGEHPNGTASARVVDPLVRPFLHRHVSNRPYDTGERVVLFDHDLAGALEIDC